MKNLFDLIFLTSFLLLLSLGTPATNRAGATINPGCSASFGVVPSGDCVQPNANEVVDETLTLTTVDDGADDTALTAVDDEDTVILTDDTGNTQGDVGTGIQSAIKSCTGASGGIPSMLSSLGNSVGLDFGNLTSSLTSTIVGGAGSVLQNIGVSLGSQIFADAGSILNTFAGEGLGSALEGLGSLTGLGEGISGIMSSFGGISSIAGPISAIMGGGGPVPTADKKTQEATAAIKKKETCDDAIAYAMAHNITLPTAIARATNYLNTGGTGGTPLFVTNATRYYQNIANEQTKILLGEVSRSGSPFASQIMPSVIRTSQNRGRDNFTRKIAPKLEQRVGAENAARFRAGDPSGCPGQQYMQCLQSTIFNPGDSFLGSAIITYDTLDERQTSAVNNAKDEVAAGQGMLGNKECVAEETDEETGETYCVDYETITPAIAASAQLQQVVESPIRQTELINSAGESLPPIFTRFINQFLGNGLSQMSRTGGFAASISSYNNRAVGQVTSTLNTAVRNTQNYRPVLEQGARIAGNILRDLNTLTACYNSVDSLLLENNQTVEPTSSRPAAEEISNRSNYQAVFDGYTAELSALTQNPNRVTNDQQILTTVGQVSALNSKKTAIAGYLTDCRARETSLRETRRDITNSSDSSGGD
ncbi:MAG: hypothetical protein AAB428_00620 [Patescibacteria group bacterium]